VGSLCAICVWVKIRWINECLKQIIGWKVGSLYAMCMSKDRVDKGIFKTINWLKSGFPVCYMCSKV